jgi:hypothetical protein
MEGRDSKRCQRRKRLDVIVENLYPDMLNTKMNLRNIQYKAAITKELLHASIKTMEPTFFGVSIGSVTVEMAMDADGIEATYKDDGGGGDGCGTGRSGEVVEGLTAETMRAKDVRVDGRKLTNIPSRFMSTWAPETRCGLKIDLDMEQ